MKICRMLGFDPEIVTYGRGIGEYTKEFYPEFTRSILDAHAGTPAEDYGAEIVVESAVEWEDKAAGWGSRQWYINANPVEAQEVRDILESGNVDVVPREEVERRFNVAIARKQSAARTAAVIEQIIKRI